MEGINGGKRFRGLTGRERILLGITGILLAWTAAFRLAVAPAGEKSAELREFMEKMETLPPAGLEEESSALICGEQAADFLYKDLDSAFMDQDLQELADRAGAKILRMEIGEPAKEQEGIFETRISLDFRCGSMESAENLERAIDGREKSVFLTQFSAWVNRENEVEGRMEVVYCYEEE